MGNIMGRRDDGDGEVLSSESGYHSIEYIDPLYSAIKRGNVIEIERCLRRGGHDINSPFIGVGLLPIHLACEKGSLNTVRCLIEHGGSVNSLDEFGSSPLISASRGGHCTIVRYLLQHGADINHRAMLEQMPNVLSMEIVGAPRDHVAEIRDPYSGNTALIQSCREHHLDIAEELLFHGCDSNLKNDAGNTALHIACLSRTANAHTGALSQFVPSTLFLGGNPVIVRLLLVHYTDMDVTNHQGDTPLQRALRVTHMTGPLSMWEWGFTDREMQLIVKNTLLIIQDLVTHGCHLPHLGPEGSPLLTSFFILWDSVVQFDQHQLLQKIFFHVAKLLVLSGCRIDLDILATLEMTRSVYFRRSEEFFRWLRFHAQNPLKLKDITRISVLHATRQPLHKNFQYLPIPPTLREQLLFEMVDYRSDCIS